MLMLQVIQKPVHILRRLERKFDLHPDQRAQHMQRMAAQSRRLPHSDLQARAVARQQVIDQADDSVVAGPIPHVHAPHGAAVAVEELPHRAVVAHGEREQAPVVVLVELEAPVEVADALSVATERLGERETREVQARGDGLLLGRRVSVLVQFVLGSGRVAGRAAGAEDLCGAGQDVVEGGCGQRGRDGREGCQAGLVVDAEKVPRVGVWVGVGFQ